MDNYDRNVNLRKAFLLFSSKIILFLIVSLLFIIIVTSSYYMKVSKANKAVEVTSVKSEDSELQLKESIDLLAQLSIEKDKLLNEIEYNSSAKAVLTYSIYNENGVKNIDEVDLFYRAVSNVLNNGNIARKLKVANRTNNLFSIDLSNALDFDNSVLVIISISAKDNATLTSIETELDELLKSIFSSFTVVQKSVERNDLDTEKLENLRESERIVSLKITNTEQKIDELRNKPKEDVEIISPAKGMVIRALFVFVFSFLLMGLWCLLKVIYTPYVIDLGFTINCLGLQNLAVIDSERIKKNWFTKLFMRKATYSNKDAYEIVRIYLKEKENLSVLSFLDSEKENEFKAATGANVVNCNGDLSDLFKVIADKNNFVILIDTEATRTKQVIEVYNFVKNLGLEMYGAVAYTI